MLISTPVLNAPTSTKAALPESVADENTIEVTNPGATLGARKPIAYVKCATHEVVDAAVAAAKAALPGWAGLTVKRRAQIMLRFHALIEEHRQELVDLIVKENGKNVTEAAGDVAKGLETVEWACSLPQLAQGRILPVSSGVTCHEEHEPVGVVASIVPFNFPFMVPMWTLPIALTCGNTVVLKPSEKVPLTMDRTFKLLHGGGPPRRRPPDRPRRRPTVEALTDHPDVNALTFVGSSRVAKIVHDRARRRQEGDRVGRREEPPGRRARSRRRDGGGRRGRLVRRLRGAAVHGGGGPPDDRRAAAARDAKVRREGRALKPGQAAGRGGPAHRRGVRGAHDADRRRRGGRRRRGPARRPQGRRGGGRRRPAGGHWFGPTVLKFPASMAAPTPS